MSLTYRCAHGSDTWHFRTDCARWPRVDFDEAGQTPATGRCCFECTYWPASRAPRAVVPDITRDSVMQIVRSGGGAARSPDVRGRLV
jgi:hypothetical protein